MMDKPCGSKTAPYGWERLCIKMQRNEYSAREEKANVHTIKAVQLQWEHSESGRYGYASAVPKARRSACEALVILR